MDELWFGYVESHRNLNASDFILGQLARSTFSLCHTCPPTLVIVSFVADVPNYSPLSARFRLKKTVVRSKGGCILIPDPRVNHWMMMSSPLPTMAICLFYAYFSKVLGPRLMENKKPFRLRGILITYNLIQTLFSSWIFYEARTHQAAVPCTPGYYFETTDESSLSIMCLRRSGKRSMQYHNSWYSYHRFSITLSDNVDGSTRDLLNAWFVEQTNETGRKIELTLQNTA
ncbi:hypothetical protein WN51_07520 [Melipona quadrifasciata]|uniref:Elongation of very long chain fatty acids protein n=1 Tax=Melipona quadrifasciata TaxID=166423 RepID=A0A0M9A9K8_9HYME|nr:hypothetical protein WN51_07520 [Melipona quadrifasciata]